LALMAVATLDCSKPVNELKMGKMWISSTNAAMSAILLLDSILFLNVPFFSRLRQLFHKLAFFRTILPLLAQKVNAGQMLVNVSNFKGLCEDCDFWLGSSRHPEALKAWFKF
jgi:hypothetical protein